MRVDQSGSGARYRCALNCRYTGWMTRRTALLAFTGVFGLRAADKPKELSSDELEKYLEKGNVFFLDVREPKEIETLGSIKGYVNIPLSQLQGRLSEIPKNKLVITA